MLTPSPPQQNFELESKLPELSGVDEADPAGRMGPTPPTMPTPPTQDLDVSRLDNVFARVRRAELTRAADG